MAALNSLIQTCGHLELTDIHHPFHWNSVKLSCFFTCWVIWGYILGILNFVMRLWAIFKSSGDVEVLFFALPGNRCRCFRMRVPTCFLWGMVLMSVQFLKTLQWYSGLFCISTTHWQVWILGDCLLHSLQNFGMLFWVNSMHTRGGGGWGQEFIYKLGHHFLELPSLILIIGLWLPGIWLPGPLRQPGILFSCLPYTYFKCLSIRGQKEERNIMKILPTLFRHSLKREMFPPSEF